MDEDLSIAELQRLLPKNMSVEETKPDTFVFFFGTKKVFMTNDYCEATAYAKGIYFASKKFGRISYD